MSSPSDIVIQTPRLHLRKLRADDLDTLAHMYNDEQVMRYIGSGGVRTRERARQGLEAMIAKEARQGFGTWSAVLKSTGAMIGTCGFILWGIEGRKETEISYLIARPYWGRGLATEAAGAVRDYGFGTLGCGRLISLIHEQNHASKAVARKTGLTYEHDVEVKGMHVELHAIEKPH
ncbi:MAG: GNAT family N-acetyltransferase [Phycisphaerae bacterium]